MPPQPTEVVTEYFRRVAARDPQVSALFSIDASLIGLGTIVSGRRAIEAFYRDSIDRASPTPELLAPLFVDGSRVGAEIRIGLSDGSSLHVMDLFVVNDGFMDTVHYFVAD